MARSFRDRDLITPINPEPGPYPTPEQLRRLAFIIKCEDDYLMESNFLIKFAGAVLALWGVGGYVHTHKPTEHQLALLADQSD
jgi:hypothetical protein